MSCVCGRIVAASSAADDLQRSSAQTINKINIRRSHLSLATPTTAAADSLTARASGAERNNQTDSHLHS